MRNPERIRFVCDHLAELWIERPDMRLGQLLWFAAGRDPFHIEDYDMLESLEDKLDKAVDLGMAPEYWIEPNAFKELIQSLHRKVNRNED